MEKLSITINKDTYLRLHNSGALNKDNHEIKYIDETFDYSSYPEWEQAKKLSDQAYRLLKKVEFEIRNSK